MKKLKSILLSKKIKQKKFIKKRKSINIRFKSLRIEKLLKSNYYIPYFLIISIIILAIILFLIFWPIFKVKNIEITKKDDITNMNIAYKSIENFRWKSILKINEEDFFKKFKKYQENIKSIDLNIDLPNTIKIKIWSHRKLFNVNINDKSYILVENWTIVPSKPSKNLRELIIIKNIDKNKFIDYKKIFEEKFLSKINEIIKKLEENIINIKIKNIIYYEIEREIHIKLENNTILIFSIDNSIEVNEQIKKLVIFNQDHISIEKNNFVYLDLRIKNKIFFCPIDNEYVCKQNIKSIYNK